MKYQRRILFQKFHKTCTMSVLESLLPLIALLMTHVQDIKAMDGSAKEKLVMSCLDILIERLPFPENKVIEPVVNAVAPGAIAGILAGSQYAEKHFQDIIQARRPERMSFFNSLTLPKRTMFRSTRGTYSLWPRKSPPKTSNFSQGSRMQVMRPNSLLTTRMMFA